MAAVAVSVVGIFFIDQARRVAPSLQVIASGEGVTADHVRVVLHTLGTRPPLGLEVPTGTDATFLHDIGISSDSKSLGSSGGCLADLHRPAPEPVAAQGPGQGRHRAQRRALPQSRAGQRRCREQDPPAQGASTTKPAQRTRNYDPPALTVDFAAFAAAITITGMAKVHEGSGLGGATSWESIGLQHTGTRFPVGHPLRALILARAVEADPGQPDGATRLLERAVSACRRQGNPRQVHETPGKEFTRLPVTDPPAEGAQPTCLRLRALYSLLAASVEPRPPSADNPETL